MKCFPKMATACYCFIVLSLNPPLFTVPLKSISYTNRCVLKFCPVAHGFIYLFSKLLLGAH